MFYFASALATANCATEKYPRPDGLRTTLGDALRFKKSIYHRGHRGHRGHREQEEQRVEPMHWHFPLVLLCVLCGYKSHFRALFDCQRAVTSGTRTVFIRRLQRKMPRSTLVATGYFRGKGRSGI